MIDLTTHILDTSLGIPAANVKVTLYDCSVNPPIQLGIRHTSENGRCEAFRVADPTSTEKRLFKLHYDIESYFAHCKQSLLFPFIEISFQLTDSHNGKLHIPLLITPFSYSTYRGS